LTESQKAFTWFDPCQEGSPAVGVGFFAPERLRIHQMPSLKFQKLGLSASNSLKFSRSGIC
jgi:hypothetical protein